MNKFLFILYCVLHGVSLLIIFYIAIVLYKSKSKPKNKVHFYIARDKNGYLYLHIGKPFRDGIEFRNNLYMYYRLHSYSFKYLGLNEKDYTKLKWEDKPVEVFLNMKN